MNRYSAQVSVGIGLIFVFAILTLNGCSFSYSSKSSSASSESSSTIASSPFTSSSGSVGGKQKKYQEEVVGYTDAYVRSSTADYDGFRKGLADLAEKYGITNWEAQPITYNAIGRGLRKAGLKGVEYETFKKNLAAGESTKMNDIDRGYNAKD